MINASSYTHKTGAVYPMETYLVKPKSSGLRISYVLGLLRIAFA